MAYFPRRKEMSEEIIPEGWITGRIVAVHTSKQLVIVVRTTQAKKADGTPFEEKFYFAGPIKEQLREVCHKLLDPGPELRKSKNPLKASQFVPVSKRFKHEIRELLGLPVEFQVVHLENTVTFEGDQPKFQTRVKLGELHPGPAIEKTIRFPAEIQTPIPKGPAGRLPEAAPIDPAADLFLQANLPDGDAA